MKQHRSKIWLLPTETLQKVVADATSFSAILRTFDLVNKGGNHVTLKRRLQTDGIRYDHIPLGTGSNGIRYRGGKVAKPLCEILIEHSLYRGHHKKLKQRLITERHVIDQCSICKICPEWNGKILVLQLDHINGISDDYRESNLRFLCPNCHSQTEFFAGKNCFVVQRQDI